MKIKNKFLLLVIYLIAFHIRGQSKIEIGEKHKIFSETLNEEREFWVYLPSNYNDAVYAPERYPVVYFLDGDRHFHSLTGIHDFLSKGPYASLPEMIFVGVLTNKHRNRDLTPTHVSSPKVNGTIYFPNGGGNAKFMQFIEEELMPLINKTYRTNGYKTLIGHSFGGLAVLNTLLSKPELFNAYIAIDPSVWWDNKYVLKKAQKILNTLNLKERMLYLTQAYNKSTPLDTIGLHDKAIVDFKRELELNNNKGLKWSYCFFDEEDHGTISLPSAYYGLRYVFNGYQIQVEQVM